MVHMDAQGLCRLRVDVVISDGAGGEMVDSRLGHGLQQGAVHPGIAQHGDAAAALRQSQSIRREGTVDRDQLHIQLLLETL